MPRAACVVFKRLNANGGRYAWASEDQPQTSGVVPLSAECVKKTLSSVVTPAPNNGWDFEAKTLSDPTIVEFWENKVPLSHSADSPPEVHQGGN